MRHSSSQARRSVRVIRGQRLLFRATAVLLVHIMLGPALLWTFSSPAWAQERSPVSLATQVLEHVADLAAPDLALDNGGPLVVHIQDLHCHYEVQQQIAGLLARLVRTSGLKLVGVEGAAGSVHCEKISTFPDARIRKQLGDYFLRQGQITGAEYAAGVDLAPVRLEGIEDARLYHEGLASARRLLRDEIQGYCLDLQEILKPGRDEVYSQALRDFDDLRRSYMSGKTGLAEYAGRLAAIGKRRSPEPAAVAEMRARLGTQQASGPDALWLAAEALDRELREAMYTSAEEREFDQLRRRAEIVERLVNLSATPEETSAFLAAPERYRLGALLAELRRLAPKAARGVDPDLAHLDVALDEAARFYRNAEERSAALAGNLAGLMRESDEPLAVLISGGYHTGQLAAACQTRGLSFVSVKPKLTQFDLVNPYYTLLQGRPGSLETYLSRRQVFFQIPTRQLTGPIGPDVPALRALPAPTRAFYLRFDLLGKTLLLAKHLAPGVGLDAWPDRVRDYAREVQRYPWNHPEIVLQAQALLDAGETVRAGDTLAAPFAVSGQPVTAVVHQGEVPGRIRLLEDHAIAGNVGVAITDEPPAETAKAWRPLAGWASHGVRWSGMRRIVLSGLVSLGLVLSAGLMQDRTWAGNWQPSHGTRTEAVSTKSNLQNFFNRLNGNTGTTVVNDQNKPELVRRLEAETGVTLIDADRHIQILGKIPYYRLKASLEMLMQKKIPPLAYLLQFSPEMLEPAADLIRNDVSDLAAHGSTSESLFNLLTKIVSAPDLSEGGDVPYESDPQDPAQLQFSPKGRIMLTKLEGKVVDASRRHVVYQDQGGLDTIGYGHLVRPGEKERFSSGISETEAQDLLRQDLQRFEALVKSSLKRHVTQAQFDALIMFAFNIGPDAFRKSGLVSVLNSGQQERIESQWKQWRNVTINGVKQISSGLEWRRNAEWKTFARGNYLLLALGLKIIGHIIGADQAQAATSALDAAGLTVAGWTPETALVLFFVLVAVQAVIWLRRDSGQFRAGVPSAPSTLAAGRSFFQSRTVPAWVWWRGLWLRARLFWFSLHVRPGQSWSEADVQQFNQADENLVWLASRFFQGAENREHLAAVYLAAPAAFSSDPWLGGYDRQTEEGAYHVWLPDYLWRSLRLSQADTPYNRLLWQLAGDLVTYQGWRRSQRQRLQAAEERYLLRNARLLSWLRFAWGVRLQDRLPTTVQRFRGQLILAAAAARCLGGAGWENWGPWIVARVYARFRPGTAWHFRLLAETQFTRGAVERLLTQGDVHAAVSEANADPAAIKRLARVLLRIARQAPEADHAFILQALSRLNGTRTRLRMISLQDAGRSLTLTMPRVLLDDPGLRLQFFRLPYRIEHPDGRALPVPTPVRLWKPGQCS